MADVLVFSSAVDPFPVWRDALMPLLGDVEVRTPDDIAAPEKVRYALVWKPPENFFAPYRNLEMVVNLGAGVDALVGRSDLPDVPITRLSDPEMGRMMAGFVLFAVLRHAREIVSLEAAQRRREWRYIHPRAAGEITVGIMGLGELGAMAASELARQGFAVRGWSRTPKAIAGVQCVHGAEALPDFLSKSEILVVMLPLTAQTRGLLDAERIAFLPRGAKIVNVSRGAVVDEGALIAALEAGRIAEATLDVFETEPLPAESPLWAMANVLVTPHLASVAIPSSAARQIADNIARLRSGRPVLHWVDPARGY